MPALQYRCACNRPTTASQLPGGPSPPRPFQAGGRPYSGLVPASHPPGRPLTVPSEPLLAVIVGPTGSGKTALSLALAARFRGEVVNCDSVAMYREFEIGTAKPTAAERARAPHHLLDFIDPTGFITAGEYARQARRTLEGIQSRQALPIVVGGTGLYLRALLEGLFAGPQRSEELRWRLRRRSEEKGSAYLHRILGRLDPVGAAQIHANDLPKLVRAIEICLVSRMKMTEIWRQGRDPLRGFRLVRFGLNPDRDALYRRIDQRAQGMFAAGLVEETRALLARYGDRARPLAAHGYKQAVQLLRGAISHEAAVQAAQQAHRRYAKRQMTWFRREPAVLWLAGFGDEANVQTEAIRKVADLRLSG
jgi:tRNA dimethylallyltransferase